MKSKLILGTFLLLLFICPMIFISSYASPGIVAQPNMNKDFSVSEDWYNETWNYRKKISIDGGAIATETDYQVFINVTYDGHMDSDFEDIIFVDEAQETLLDHWRETYTVSTFAVFWVEVKDAISKGVEHDGALTYINMYYGNDAVESTSNGTATFLFFDDFENNNLDRWDTTEANWATTGAEKKYGSYSVFGDADDTGRDLFKDFSPSLTGDFMVHCWARFEEETGTEFPIFANDGEADEVYLTASRIDDFSTYDSAAWVTYDEETAIDDTWIRLELAVDNTNSAFRLWVDSVAASNTRPNKDGAGNTISGLVEIGSITSTVEGIDSWLDDYYIRKWILDEPEIISFAEEESNFPPPEWEESGEAELIFNVPIDETGLNMLLIFLGLFMIPASTLYLVKGGKSEASMDKLFFGLIAFVIGWALFLGGIYA